MNKREIIFFVVLIAIFALLATLQKNQPQPQQEARIPPPLPPKEMKVRVLIETTSKAKKNTAKKKHSGAMPPITATYRQTIGFENYASMMEQRGAVFLMKSRHKGSLIQLSLLNGKCRLISLDELRRLGLSSRIRKIARESTLDDQIKHAANLQAYGNVFMLIPQVMEEKIAKQFYNAYGVGGKVLSLKGTYHRSGGNLLLKIHQVCSMKGKSSEAIEIVL